MKTPHDSGFKKSVTARTPVAQLVGHCPANQKFLGLIPGQGTCLGVRAGTQLGACERQLIDVSIMH